jgi:hypothetical protein
MAMSLVRDSELRLLLIDGKLDEFNEKAGENPPDLERAWLRGVDLREADLSHANLRGAYLRAADLRGVDLLHADLEEASIQGARVSGARLPRNLEATEVMLSLVHGTRLRTRRD